MGQQDLIATPDQNGDACDDAQALLPLGHMLAISFRATAPLCNHILTFT
jgi:hypothetical protein